MVGIGTDLVDSLDGRSNASRRAWSSWMRCASASWARRLAMVSEREYTGPDMVSWYVFRD